MVVKLGTGISVLDREVGRAGCRDKSNGFVLVKTWHHLFLWTKVGANTGRWWHILSSYIENQAFSRIFQKGG